MIKPKQSGIDRKASRTAMWTNICRAMANKEKHPEFHGPDDMAKIFMPPAKNFFLSFKFIRAHIRRHLTPGAYEYLLARTNHFDNIYKHQLVENIPQIILLGAGYDTRSIRFKDSIQDTMIFELDAPSTLQHRIKFLKKAGITIPEEVSLVPIDFNKERIDNVLSKTGYDKTNKSLFIWEGVTMYLHEEAVKNTLDFIRNNSGPESTIAFDYFFKAVVDGKSEYYGAKEQYDVVRKLGEPFQFGIEEGQIESFLLEHSFYLLSHYTPDEFERKYLYDDNDVRFGKMHRCGCNVHAGIRS